MSTYRDDTAGALRDAATWASESTTRTLNAYVDMVERSRSGTYTADQLANDVAAMTVGMQQDVARAATTWSRLLTGLIK